MTVEHFTYKLDTDRQTDSSCVTDVQKLNNLNRVGFIIVLPQFLGTILVTFNI